MKPLNNSQKKEIRSRYREKNETIEDIAKAMNISHTTVSKYKDYVGEEESSGDTKKETASDEPLTEEQKEEIKKKEGEEKEPPEQEGRKPSTPYEEAEPADVFFRKFLSEFPFKEDFVDLICRRVKRRNALPYPSDLAADIQEMLSGITNPKSANYIAEEYSYELKDYEKRLKDTNKLRSSMGYNVDSYGSHNTDHDGLHQGISLDGYKEDDGQVRDSRRGGERQKVEKTPVDPIEEVLKRHRVRRAERLEKMMNDKEIADVEREISGGEEGEEEKKHTLIVDGVSLKLTTEEMLSWKHYLAEEKRAEEEREERKAERKAEEKKAEDERKQQEAERQRLDAERRSQNDGGLIEWVVGEGNNTRIIKVRPETIPLLMAQGSRNPSQNDGGLSREEVAQMVERSFEAKTKHMTTDDVEKIVQRSMGDRVALTKDDLRYMEARDNLHLEEKKLDESGKTRDVISDAIRDGFGHAGRIISRMMTEEGGGTGMPVDGYSDQAGNMMQVACPGCNTVITAPIGSQMVVCPGCKKRWVVEQPGHEQFGYEQIPPKAEEKPPVDEFVPREKEVIQKSLEDAKEGRIEPLEPATSEPEIISKPTTATPEVTHEPTTDASADVEKIAENIAIGEGVKKLEEEVKKESSVEKKPVRLKRCPVCKKPFKNRRAVASHITKKHPEYHKK